MATTVFGSTTTWKRAYRRRVLRLETSRSAMTGLSLTYWASRFGTWELEHIIGIEIKSAAHAALGFMGSCMSYYECLRNR
jgi:hypothetical protein